MHEFLPFGGGLAIGLALCFVTMHRLRWVAFPLSCIVVGALMSWLNGEFTSALWPLFVSFDALLVWAGATLVLVADAARHRFAQSAS